MSLISSVFNQIFGCLGSVRRLFYSPRQAMKGVVDRIDSNIESKIRSLKTDRAEQIGIQSRIKDEESKFENLKQSIREEKENGNREKALNLAKAALNYEKSLSTLREADEKYDVLIERNLNEVTSLKSEKTLLESRMSSMGVRHNTALQTIEDKSTTSGIKNTRKANEKLVAEAESYVSGIENRAVATEDVSRALENKGYVSEEGIRLSEMNAEAEKFLDKC